MKRLFKPAVALMNQLRYPQKFVLIGFLLLLPLGWVLSQYVANANSDINFSSKERVGVEYLRPATDLLQAVQKHMALSAAVRQGATEFEPDLAQTRADVETAITKVDQVDQRLGETLGTTESWTAIRVDWEQLKDDADTLAPQQIIDRHTALIDSILALIVQAGNNSNLILDPDIDTYYLMDSVIVQNPRATSYYSQLRANALNTMIGLGLDPVTRTRLIVYLGLGQSAVNANQRGLDYVYNYNPKVRESLGGAQDASLSAQAKFDTLLNDSVMQSAISNLTRREVYASATDAIDARFALNALAFDKLDELAKARIDRFAAQRNLAIAIALLSFVVAVYLFFGFYLAVRRVIDHLDRASHRMVAGDGETALVLDSRDELAEVANSFNKIAGELVAARDQALEASRAKSTFLANMSHELRTPLNAIIGYSELLIEEATDIGDESTLPDLNKIRNAGRHLLGLINDILDMSKIEAGKMELYLEPLEIKLMLSEVTTTIQKMIEKNNNRLQVIVSDNVGTMEADVTKLRQSLFNLLSNASKFTHDGVIVLTASRHNAPPEDWKPQNGYYGDWLIFTVSDNGIGMSPDQLARVFREFEQADASTTRKYGGTGLGLAITQRFCQMMGGDIKAESELGNGSTFTIWLPAEAIQPEEPTSTAAAPALPVNASTVLVIDDDPAVRDMMQRFLNKEGFRVVTARGGQEGLGRAREIRPAVITLDVMMPHMDGWAVLSALKADPELSNIPVILVTIVDQKEMGFMLGASDYLTKPVDRERLASVLERYRCGDLPCQVLIVEDDDPTREMMRRMLEDEGWVVSEAENGRIGLDAVARRRPELILLDLMMPEVDGFQFLAELRANVDPITAALPVVVVTARDLTRQERELLSSNVEKIIQKGGQEQHQTRLLEEIREIVRAYLQPVQPT